jgi:hypothetical protein
MSQQSSIEPFEQDGGAVVDYRRQAREFLVKSRQYLAEDDLHQASEKGWGAAAWMAKAVAEAQGWKYTRHDEFFVVMNQIEQTTGNRQLGSLKGEANLLHGYFYTRKRYLSADDIGRRLDQMVALLDILEPLTQSANVE